MDERERMRSVLAELLGWEGFGKDGQESEDVYYWRGAMEDGTPFKIYATDWLPDERWEHAGWVIEAMRAKGWRLELDANTDCVEAVFYLGNDTRGYAALYDTVPEAVSVAACCALEATDD